MSKAVEKAYEAYPFTESNRLNAEWNAMRVGFQHGYEQAEKDFAQYIDKNAVTDEIRKRINDIDQIGTYLSPRGVLQSLLCHIESMETKGEETKKGE